MTELPEPVSGAFQLVDDVTLAPEHGRTQFSRYLLNLTARFACEVSGVSVVLFALTLPIIIMVAGGTIDYATLTVQKTKLQAASDAAAIAVARELHLANTETGRLQPIAKSVVNANLGDTAAGVNISTKATLDPLSITVDLKQSFDGYFLNQFMASTLTAHSVARVSGGTPLCVLALDEVERGNITLEMSARLSGTQCAVYSNSRSASGIVSKNGANLEAELICSAGGIDGGSANFTPAALTDCPPMQDPLAGRLAPPVGPCVANNMNIGGVKANKGQQVSGLNKETKAESKGKEEKVSTDTIDNYDATYVMLKPGTYCGGLTIGGAAQVQLLPGIYVIEDGPLFVSDFATLKGENVGFYFKGKKATLFLNANTSISLIAPVDGPMAGLLFFQDRDTKPDERFSILSDNAHVLEGTLYIFQADLFIDADEPIADQSAYTVIIANSMSLYAGPHVVLNTDYDATDVPVPGGIANDRVITLTE